MREGVVVTGLIAEAGEPATVTGVASTAGAVLADVVVDASGRRTALDTG